MKTQETSPKKKFSPIPAIDGITTTYESGTGNIIHQYKGRKFFQFFTGSFLYPATLKSYYQLNGQDFNSLELLLKAIDYGLA